MLRSLKPSRAYGTAPSHLSGTKGRGIGWTGARATPTLLECRGAGEATPQETNRFQICAMGFAGITMLGTGKKSIKALGQVVTGIGR
jgi:hypothetical protein